MLRNKNLSLVILVSGNGSNLQAIIDAIRLKTLDAKICAVISDNKDSYALIRAKQSGIETKLVEAKNYESKSAYNRALLETIDQYQPELVVLAGFMRILGRDIVQHYFGRLINIHPSLLPNHRGLNTHERVLEAQDEEHGASVHFVTEELDGGPIIAQAKLKVNEDDTPESLRVRVLKLEHKLYPLVISWFCQNKLILTKNGILFKDLDSSGKSGIE